MSNKSARAPTKRSASTRRQVGGGHGSYFIGGGINRSREDDQRTGVKGKQQTDYYLYYILLHLYYNLHSVYVSDRDYGCTGGVLPRRRRAPDLCEER